MKIPPFVVPVAVALAGACWLGARQAEIVQLREAEEAAVERRVSPGARVAATSGGDRGARESAGGRMRRLAKAHQEWGGTPWLRANWAEVDEVEHMTREELIALLDAMEGTDVEKGRLEFQILELLEKIDPEYVTRRVGRISALGAWARRDPKGAVAWYEEQVAAGKFDPNKNLSGDMGTAQFEMLKSLVWGLGASDPAAARAQIVRLPEENRGALFEKWYSPGGWSMHADNLPAMVRLMREFLTVEEQANLATWPFWEVGDFGEGGLLKDWAQLDTYLATIQATPEAQRSVALAVAKNGRFPRASGNYFATAVEDIDALRSWVARKSSETLTEATAAALSMAGGRSEQEFKPWVDYALRLHADGEGDAVLVAVLESSRASEHPELVRPLIERLQPGEDRERFMKELERAKP